MSLMSTFYEGDNRHCTYIGGTFVKGDAFNSQKNYNIKNMR